MKVNYTIIPEGKFWDNDLLDIFVRVNEIMIKHSLEPYDCTDEVTIEYDICLEYFSDDEEKDFIVMPDGKNGKKIFELYCNRDFYQDVLEKSIEEYYSRG